MSQSLWLRTLPIFLLAACQPFDYSIENELNETDEGSPYSSATSGYMSLDSFLLRWEVGSTWSQGQCVNFSLENQGRDVNSWTLLLELDSAISKWPSTSGAVIEPYGDQILVKSFDELGFGETLEFQYCAEPKLTPQAIAEVTYDGQSTTGDGDPTDLVSLEDTPIVLRYRKNGTSFGGTCLDLEVINRGDKAISSWSIDLTLDQSASPTDWWGDISPISWGDGSVEIIPNTFARTIDPLEAQTGTLCLSPESDIRSISAIVSYSDGSTGGGDSGDALSGTGPIYSLRDDPLFLHFREDGTSNDGICYNMQIANGGSLDLSAWSFFLNLDNAAQPTDYTGDFYPIYWNDNRVEMVPTASSKSLQKNASREARLCLANDAFPTSIEASVDTSGGSTGSGDTTLYTLRDYPLNLIYKFAGTESGGTCLDMEVTNIGDVDLNSWSLDLALSTAANPTAYSGEIAPIYWSGDTMEIAPVAHKQDLKVFEKASGRLCLSPESRPVDIEATVSSDDDGGDPTPDDGTDGGESPTVGSLRDGDLYLHYQITEANTDQTCYDLELINGGSDTVTGWEMSLSFSETIEPTDFVGDFFPLSWFGGVVEFVPTSTGRTINSLDSQRATFCMTPHAEPTDIDIAAQFLIGGGDSGSTGGTGGSTPFEVLRDEPITLVYSIDGSSKGGTCVRMQATNTGSKTISDFSLSMTLSEAAKPTDWSGDLMPTFWSGTRLEVLPQPYRRSLEPNASAEGIICLTPTATPVTLDATVAYSGYVGDEGGDDGGDGGSSVAVPIVDGPLTLLYKEGGQTASGASCLSLELINASDKAIDTWTLDVTFNSTVNPVDWYGDLRPLSWSQSQLTLVPPGYDTGLGSLDAASGTLCLSPDAIPRYMEAHITFADGSTYANGQTAYPPEPQGPISNKGLTLLFKEKGTASGGARCMELELVNLGDEAIESWEADVTFSGAVNPVDWYGELRPVSWDGTVLHLVPPSYATGLEVYGAATGTLCLDPYVEPRDLDVTLKIAEGSVAENTVPLTSGPLTLIYADGGETSSGSCMDLSLQNSSSEDLLSWSVVVEMQDNVLPVDWWGDLYPTDWQGAFVTLKPVSHAPTLEAGGQALMTLCTAAKTSPKSMSARVDLATAPGGGAPLRDGDISLIYTIAGSSSGGTCLDLEIFNSSVNTYSGYVIDLEMSATVNVTDYWGLTPLWEGNTLSLYPPSWDNALTPYDSIQGTICLSPVAIPLELHVY